MTQYAVIQVKPGIGDTLWHLPFVRAIAAGAPGGKVTFLSPPSSLARELFTAEPAIAETVYFAHGGNEIVRGLNLIRLSLLLRSHRFQRIYILDRTTRPAVAARLAGIPERIGIGLGSQRAWITNAGIEQTHFHAHPIDWLKRLMVSEGIALNSTEPELRVPPSIFTEIDARFALMPRPWVVLGLGASHPDKDWPDRRWKEFLLKIPEKHSGTTFFVGGDRWNSRASALIAGANGNVVNACGLTILQSAALLRRADVFAGPDSGALNLAAAVGTEAYGVFGLTPPLTYSRHIHVVSASADAHVRAPMANITADRLLAALLPRLCELAR